VTAPALLDELRLEQSLLAGLLENLAAADWRTQTHPDLSPAGWHLGHCAFVETYWLQEVILGDRRYTDPVSELYNPALTPKPERGRLLPAAQALTAWVEELQNINAAILRNPPAEVSRHPLMREDYLLHFLVQHYCQHFETVVMILTRLALAADDGDFTVHRPLEACNDRPSTVRIDAGHYRVGGREPVAYDNELPARQVTLGPFEIAVSPVSNGAYLAFMEAGGYTRPELWDPAGRDWLERSGARAPDHWRRNRDGHWYGIGNRGPYELAGTDTLHGINWYEARAFARQAGARLPHEHQWEVAHRLRQLAPGGRAWEWCDNRFCPYAGFRAFPYEDYSTPWFDGNHYTLRGGSLHTRPAIRRPSFRNFYTPDKRHVFAGLRLVFDTQLGPRVHHRYHQNTRARGDR